MSWLRVILWPISLCYGLLMYFRNKLFDWRILPSRSFPVPLIGVGNLSTGGTGKTPHAEYLIRLLGDKKKLAILSRGYKRSTKGFRLVQADSAAREAGDEPVQIKRKFPEVMVAVHENRRKGIDRILKDEYGAEVVVLDDAFQHRYVKPDINLLLTEYYNPFFQNYPLPCGNLREVRTGVKRADALIVTKTPRIFSPLDRRFFLQKLQAYGLKQIFFSSLNYLKPVPLFDGTASARSSTFKTIFLLTGIANPSALEEHLKNKCQELLTYKYPDHYAFKTSDLRKIRDHYHANISNSKAIITTEKDAVRLQSSKAKEILSDLPVYYIPVEVYFHEQDRIRFEEFLFSRLEQSRG